MTPPQLTYAGVLLAVLANQLCLPVPSIVFLMAAGALSAHGDMQMSTVVLLSVLPCLAADGIWFWLGRKWGSQAVRILCRLTPDPRRCSRDAHDKFGRYGLPLLCVAKFFPGLDGLMPPLAGAEGVSLTGFFALDAVGSLLWSGFYVGVGYLFSEQLELAVAWAKHFGTALALGIGVPLCIYVGWRGLTLIRMIRRLRVRLISAPMLNRKLRSGSKIALLDLLDFEEEADIESPQRNSGCIPHRSVPVAEFTADFRARRCRNRSLLFFAKRDRERAGSAGIKTNRRRERLDSRRRNPWLARQRSSAFSVS